MTLYPWTINIHRETIAAIYKLERQHVVPTRNAIAQLSNDPKPDNSIEQGDDIYTMNIEQCPIQIAYYLNERDRIVVIRKIAIIEEQQ